MELVDRVIRILDMGLSELSDDELFGRVEALAQTERLTLTDFLIHLGELDRRPACERRGYSSVFSYLTRKLGYAECDAMRRVRAARAARRFPSILSRLAKGELHLAGISMLQPILTSENHERLLRRASRMSIREIEKMVAELLPAAKEPIDRIRALPPAIPAPIIIPGELITIAEASQAPQPRVHFSFPADELVKSWFKQAQDLLRHKFPQGRMEEIIGEALRRLVESEVPQAKAKPRLVKKSRRIPRWVRNDVWKRDGGRCVFAAADGVRCGETGWLEFDHVTPWSRGGRSDDPANVRLLCRAHNQAEAERLLAPCEKPRNR